MNEASEKNGSVIVLSSPSGGGKTTICRLVRSAFSGKNRKAWISVSATTRAPRINEIDGIHYYFKTDAEFARMVENDEFLEHASVHIYSYGTPEKAVREQLEQGAVVLMDIDVQGGALVKQKLPETKLVFILPPSWDTLLKRLKARNTETPELINRRLQTALDELKAGENFEYFVVNDDLFHAVGEIYEIIHGKSVGIKDGKIRLKEILEDGLRYFNEIKKGE